LPEIAGSGRVRYQSYLDQVNEFQRKWRKLLWIKEFFQVPMSSSDYDLIARFRFTEGSIFILVQEISLPVLLLIIQADLVVFRAALL
jgi:hypothetical protein